MIRGLASDCRRLLMTKMAGLAGGDAGIKRGALIVFEGLDRSGKSTLARKLAQTLNDEEGTRTTLLAFPDRTSTRTGKIINDHLATQKSPLARKEAIHLIFSQNRWEKDNSLIELLNNGTTVILDRYIASGVSYTMAKGLPKSFACAADIGLPQPDCVFYLDVSPEVAESRANYGEEAFEKKEFQAAVRKAMDVFRKHPTWKTIDANRGKDEVFEEAKERILAVVQEHRSETIARIGPEYFGDSGEGEFKPEEFQFDGKRGCLYALDGPGSEVLAQSLSDSLNAEIVDLKCSTDGISAREKALKLAAYFWDQNEAILEKLRNGRNVVLLHYVPSAIIELLPEIEDLQWIAALFHGLPCPDAIVRTESDAGTVYKKNGWVISNDRAEILASCTKHDNAKLERFTSKNLAL
uniref:dTMP kinase n=1 Tax=Steinernema glaseri TaxID=37863 RepID=A0A1I7Z5L2_9BILA